jgi:hypothetical protein
MVKCEVRAKRLRCRVRTPIRGAEYRTQDVGTKLHSERIAMKDPRTGRWATQSWTFPVEDVRSRRGKTIEILTKLGIKRKKLKGVI